MLGKREKEREKEMKRTAERGGGGKMSSLCNPRRP